MTRKQLIERAKVAIDSVFKDRSVSAEQAVEELEEIKEHVEEYVAAVKQDIKRQEN